MLLIFVFQLEYRWPWSLCILHSKILGIDLECLLVLSARGSICSIEDVFNVLFKLAQALLHVWTLIWFVQRLVFDLRVISYRGFTIWLWPGICLLQKHTMPKKACVSLLVSWWGHSCYVASHSHWGLATSICHLIPPNGSIVQVPWPCVFWQQNQPLKEFLFLILF